MANHTLSGRFPEGATVNVYDAQKQLPGQSGPEGAVLATGTVSSGDVTFTGLTEGKQYVAFNGADASQQVSFTVDVASTELASDQDVEITGDWEFSGEAQLSGTVGLFGATPVAQQTHQADAPTDASTSHNLNSTFSDTEAEAALNALATKINSVATTVNGILDRLEALGINATS